MSKILEEAVELEQKAEAAETSQVLTEPGAPAEEAAPVLVYEEIPTPKTETAFHVTLVKQKSRKGGVIALAVLVVLIGLGAAAYRLGAFGGADGSEGLGVKNSTDLPAGAVVPAFSPINPADFAAAVDDHFIVVPDETGLELPAFGHGPQVAPEPQNHLTQTPNVSAAFTRAAQDESYVYFLQGPPAAKYGLYKLMRANPSTGKAEPATNTGDSSIYSFALLGQNIITCEHKAATDTFAFYRNPKSGEHAQLLFETASPAYMNVYDDKLFMLFVEEQALGVFDLATDTQPAYIALGSQEETAHYFPRFSVINGYLHYGIWHDADAAAESDVETDTESETAAGAAMEYFRRSLYTGESVSLLRCESGDAIWNPCWDADGNAYYAKYALEAMEFQFIVDKDGESPQTVSTFDYDGNWPLIAFKDEFLVAALPPDSLRKFDCGDFSVKLEDSAESQPFAVTKDFFVAEDGLYRLFDFEFIPFES